MLGGLSPLPDSPPNFKVMHDALFKIRLYWFLWWLQGVPWTYHFLVHFPCQKGKKKKKEWKICIIVRELHDRVNAEADSSQPLVQLVANLNSFSPCFWVRNHPCKLGTNLFLHTTPRIGYATIASCVFGINAQEKGTASSSFQCLAWSNIAMPCKWLISYLQIDRMMN